MVVDFVTIGEAPLRIEELVDVSCGAPVQLGDSARSRLRASREVIDDALSTGEAIYGLNTGVGHRKDVRLSEEELRTGQEMLVTTHAGGLGHEAPTELVRAAMTVRINGMARGGSGASPSAAEVLAKMLNAGVHPVISLTSSVGTGDLGQMAGIAKVAIGRGKAELGGEIVPGAEALKRVGIEPLLLGPKDGLALISANGISIGHAALVLAAVERFASAAEVAVALSLEATQGNPSIALPVVGRAKPYQGQIDAAENMRTALEGSYVLDLGAARSVQDALSFRVAPQVHGALREFVAVARRSVETELNSMSDNPLVSVDDKTMVHNGNFHPIVMAIAFDSLRVALAHVGQLSERRMNHLWDRFFEHLASAEGPPSTPFFGPSLRYPAAAVFSELKQLAAPATLDCPPLDLNTEDHATSAPLSVSKTEAALDHLQDLVVIELLLARDVLATGPERPRLGVGTEKALQTVEETIAGKSTEESADEIHRALRGRLFRRDVYRSRLKDS